MKGNRMNSPRLAPDAVRINTPVSGTLMGNTADGDIDPPRYSKQNNLERSGQQQPACLLLLERVEAWRLALLRYHRWVWPRDLRPRRRPRGQVPLHAGVLLGRSREPEGQAHAAARRGRGDRPMLRFWLFAAVRCVRGPPLTREGEIVSEARRSTTRFDTRTLRWSSSCEAKMDAWAVLQPMPLRLSRHSTLCETAFDGD